MKHPLLSGLLLSAACVLSACSDSTDKLSLHVFECGEIEVRDVSLFSPGVRPDGCNVGSMRRRR